MMLKYLGNKAGSPYIAGIPARDMNEHDLKWLAHKLNVTTGELVEDLTAKQPPLYVLDETYTCEQCGKPYKTWKHYNAHILTHIAEPPEPIEEQSNG